MDEKSEARAGTSREADALYQRDKVVARVKDVEFDQDARQVRFDEVSQSDALLIPEECEFREFKIQIRKIAYATNIHRGEEHKGRVLRGVIADVLGRREQ